MIQFPFPTLKNLSMIRFGHAILERRTKSMLKHYRYRHNTEGEKEDGRESDDYEGEDYEDDDYEDDYQELSADDLVSNLVRIPHLRHDLADVFRGMQEQAHNIVCQFGRTEKGDDVALIFDVHGRVDVAAAWRCYFEDQLNNEVSVEPAMDLLDFALGRKIWCNIDIIIAKIISLVGLDPDSLEEPELILDNHNKYMLAFDLEGLVDECSDDVDSRLTNIIWKHGIDDDTDRLLIPIRTLCENYVFMRKFFITMDTNEKESFIEQIIPCLHRSYEPGHSQFVSKMITDLDDEMLRHFMVKFSEFPIPDAAYFARDILKEMLHWPFTQVFVPVLELLARFLSAYDYAKLLKNIVWRVTHWGTLGTLYSDLLLKFCQAIPLNVKQDRSKCYVEKINESLKILRLYRKCQLGDRIEQILLPQIE